MPSIILWAHYNDQPDNTKIIVLEGNIKQALFINKKKSLTMKKLFVLFLVFSFTSCSKDNKTFNLKTITLNDYQRTNLPAQKLHLEVFEDNRSDAIAHTDLYPSNLTLPATFIVHPSVPMALYKKAYRFQLRGDSTGYISSCGTNMKEYKIIFPIDMEVKNDSMAISIKGNWE